MRLRLRRRGRRRPRVLGDVAFVKLLHDGSEALPAMLAAIERARHEVLLEMYWFGSDATGLRFAAALCERARAGVSTRLIYDAVGSFEADGRMFEELAEAGVEILEYNPIAPWRQRFVLSQIVRRDHRKLLVVDGRLAFTGGINLGDPWASREQGGQGFRDDAIAIEGPAVQHMRALFYGTFGLPPPPLPEPLEAPAEPGMQPARILVLAGELRRDRRDILDSYINAIARASRDVIIANSYFIPNRHVRRTLARAVQRGVRVRVLTPRHNDVWIAQLASRALYERLLRRGIELYEWDGGGKGDVLHSKTAVVDDDWCTVGSFNFDALSIHNNLELNVAVVGSEVVGRLRRRLERDLAAAVRIELEVFRRRSWLVKLVERVFYWLRWAL